MAHFYKVNANLFNNPYEALINLLFKLIIDVEEFNQDDLYHIETVEKIMFHFAKRWIRPWDEKIVEVEGLKEQIEQQINYRISIIREALNEKELENTDIVFPSSQPGLYINNRLVDHYNFNFQMDDDLLSAVQLEFDAFGPGYEILFVKGRNCYYLYSS